MADFRLTPAALRDLEGIWRYTVQQRGVTQAERYLDALNASFEALALAPFSASACDHIRPGYRRHGVERHAVYYRVEADTVIVVRVLHERMDAPRHL
ncbi:MAG: type II toxin-antitoxin system RelE/ParE family toxin [Xanthomonadaceae bacterium]|nr:type II toxin-antitoxin system RelE/ParE family toxin [Xanthomonadaceae bacterium]MDP2184362.1 type II toxin-antitoxin system RelE/ParE family toxin [Xanthomonadales bacterium]MDZ4114585.1 type II toxin-antitoxin system RelE/ParE family toxin [Xanthomonadaceae bacterium]MDZ4379662.1 type II toxin-antitoxin system RelE/ParE family toxin [Xanthomonadaceae bacterium]